MVRPRCYQLVGVPGSGKSTWLSNQEWVDKCVVVSTDEFVEQQAKFLGLTYSEVFANYMPEAVALMMGKVIAAREQEQDIVWDQTSTTLPSRQRKFKALPGYEHIAVVFRTPDPQELQRRLNSRSGKEIPASVVADMISNFIVPTVDEGFSEVWYAQ